MSVAMRVACIQMRSGMQEQANIDEMERLVAKAAGQGAAYVQTPEMTGILQRNRAALFSEISGDKDNPVFSSASRLAKRHGIWLHVGSTAVDLGHGKAANRAALFAPSGERAATYDKIHMFDVDLDKGESWRESAVFSPGDQAVVCPVGDATFGLAICYDLRFPALFLAQAVAGATVLTCPAAFTRQTGEAHWHVLLRARAIENGAFVIAAAQGGRHEDGRETFGHSLVIDPWGTIIAELDHDKPGILVCDIEPAQSRAARAKIPNLANRRGFSAPQHSDASRGAA
ncbi:MAG: carbon-nitrogen hydrolase family protein [Nitratireductor sp.]|nr:carbon-nitrogen hydrolase family protein [Nitratireductor sp.]MCB1455162.1 carbon-nitrogen hydrolase family protein [Nitratireductor sp.]